MSKLHEKIEKNVGLMIVLIAVAVSFGGLVEIVPLMFQARRSSQRPASSPIQRCSWLGATSTSARAATTAIRR